MVSGEVTRAVRDAQVDGVKVSADDFIGLVNERVVVLPPPTCERWSKP